MSDLFSATQRTYRCVYVDSENKRRTVNLQASSRASAVVQVMNMIDFRSMIAISDSTAARVNDTMAPKPENLYAFLDQFAMYLSVGVDKDSALDSARAAIPKTDYALTYGVTELAQQSAQGIQLADAMSKLPNIFPRTLMETVRVGETSDLAACIRRAADDLLVQSGQLDKIKHALRGPLLELALAFGIFMAMLAFLVPGMVENLVSMTGDESKLPAITRITMAMSRQIWWFAPSLVAVVAGLAVLYKRNRNRAGWREKIDHFWIKVPVFGGLYQRLALSRFCFTYTALHEVGMPEPEILKYSAGAVGNATYEKALISAMHAAERGESIVPVLEESPDLFPKLITSVMHMVEKTSTVGESLRAAGRRYAVEVDKMADNVADTLKPVFTVITGGLVVVAAMAIFLPYLAMANGATGF